MELLSNSHLETMPKVKIINNEKWEWIKLGEACNFIGGGTPSKKESKYWNGNINWASVKDIKGDFLNSTKDSITELGLKNSASNIAEPNDLILITRISPGKSIITNVRTAINQDLKIVRPKFQTTSKYLNYYFQAFERKIIKKSSGTTVLGITLNNLNEIQIPLLDLDAQHAIVSKIEELLSELDKGKQQLETAQQQLKIYRQAVLKWAFEGKLTNENVKEDELPEGWKWIKSGELFSYVTSGSRGWAKYYSEKGAIFIRITNMDFDSLELDLTESNIQYVDLPTNSEGKRTKIQEGDFLFSITGYLGMFAIAPKLENAYVNQHVCLCRPKAGFNKKFVGYWIILKSGGHHHLNQNQKGAVKAGLNLDDLKSFPVPLASREEQDLIVGEIESRLSVCDRVEETITTSLAQAETLRQSILKMAFEGKLI